MEALHLQGGSEGITQAVLRLRQASQGRFLRLRGCLARPNWLWMVNLRGRAWPWANGSAPLSMSCVTRAFDGERVVRRPGWSWSWTGWTGWAGLAGGSCLRRTAGGDGEDETNKAKAVAWLGERCGEASCAARPGSVADSSELADT
ncbi:uncharacterized protein TrAtP1_003049 [Trichoderma atroviride]|uniref:uncharacterized protein n=1 Tax=Hypocrea atroviridis TaxID=63577 RepID=UPI00332539AC|nr:hypothetical protein TrAtP1_003049 [Trichoderma atroviride]